MISLWSLLSIISTFSLNKILLEVAFMRDMDVVKKIDDISTELREQYSKENYTIQLKMNTGYDNRQICCVIKKET